MFWKQFFTWWNGQNVNTRVVTWLYGKRVGEDRDGNIYYENRSGEKRWVIYNGYSDASRVPVEWHGWLHHTYQAPPTEDPLKHQPWEEPHLPNLTGTALAYAPEGSLRSSSAEATPKTAYEAWQPE
ncbi:MAG: NADH:ubiquinone oxidoreductase subunit NDUFA12 [Pseudomonadota bacterium]